MKSLHSPILLALLLVPWAWGPAGGRQAPKAMLKSPCDAAGCDAADAARGACRSSQGYPKVKPESDFPWISAYVPIRSCHRVLKDKYGEFSPPVYHGDSPKDFWCSWTIWAGSKQHIIIYIQGFITTEDCNKNEDKILFEGVSSLVENSVVYACWKKEMQVFATFAQAVHVVLLKRYLPNCRDTPFKGKYYIFQDQKGESSSKGDIFETPAPKLPKQDGVFQSGWAEDLSVLGFVTTCSTVSPGRTMVLSGGLLQRRGSMLDATTVGSPIELLPYEGTRKPLLERKAPCVLLPEQIGGLRGCKEAQGRGIPGGIIHAAEQDAWSKSLTMSGDITQGFDYTPRLSSLLLETPLLGDLQEIDPLLQPADVGLENRQSVLHPTLKSKDLGDLQFTIKPAHTSCPDLAALSQALSPGRRDSEENTGTSMYQGLSTVSLEKDESYMKLSVTVDDTMSRDADALAKGLMPSLSSPYELVNGDHLQLLPERSQRCQSSFGDLSLTPPELGTTGLQPTKLIGISSLECFRGGVETKIVLHPTAPWDILQEQPFLYGQSSPVPHSTPIDLGSLSQARDCPSVEKAHVSSLGVKSCHYQNDRAAQPGLAVPPLPTGLEHASTAMFTLGTEKIPVLVVSCTVPVPMDFGYTDLSPKTFNPVVESPSSIIFSPPAALDLDPVCLRQGVDVLLASSGGQEMVSSSLPLYPLVTSELAKDESHRCLGMQKLEQGQVGGQQGEASAPMHLPAGGLPLASVTDPNPGVGLPQPEEHVSSGTGVVPSFLPGTWGMRREKHVVPVQHQGISASNKLASASNPRGLKMKKNPESLQVGAGEQRNASSSAIPAHPAPPVAWGGETVSRSQKSQELSDDPVSRNMQIPGGQQQKHAELGLPWAMEYFPVRSCHVVLQDGSGMFFLPLHADIKANIWCNWTIWAGPQKHIVVYVQGFQGSEGCGKNQDKIIFHGVSSSVETKVVYACHNRGTLIFATQATAVHVLFLSGSGFQSSEYGHFKGWYYVFRDPETVGSSNDSRALQEPVQEVSKKERWRMAVTKGLLPRLRASLGPSAVPAGGRIQTELVSPDEEAQYPQNLMEEIQSDANLSKHSQLWDETKLERNLKDSGTEEKETRDVLVEPATAGYKTEPSTLEIAKGGEELVSVLDTAVTNCSVDISSSELPRSTVSAPAKSSSLDQTSTSLSEVFAAAHHTQTPVLEELLLNTNTKPPLFTFPGVTAGGTVSLGKRNEELFDLLSALASQENDTLLQSQHHPGDVLLEVTIEIKSKDWIPHGGSEFQKGLLESMKSHVQENLKLSANRINEIKLKKIERTSSANLLLTFWLHLKPERNVSLLLHSQLEELLGTSVGVEKLQLVSLFVEDVNECNAGVSLCGEEAECFNGVGTYLCRCKKGYEDHSPTKSGTLCIRAPQSGINFFLRHADILVGAAITAAVAMLVAAGALCRAARQRRHSRKNLSPEEPPVRAVEEPAMELHDLGEWLHLDPFRLKLRARPPEWLWGARVQTSQAYQVFLEQSPQL